MIGMGHRRRSLGPAHVHLYLYLSTQALAAEDSSKGQARLLRLILIEKDRCSQICKGLSETLVFKRYSYDISIHSLVQSLRCSEVFRPAPSQWKKPKFGTSTTLR